MAAWVASVLLALAGVVQYLVEPSSSRWWVGLALVTPLVLLFSRRLSGDEQGSAGQDMMLGPPSSGEG